MHYQLIKLRTKEEDKEKRTQRNVKKTITNERGKKIKK